MKVTSLQNDGVWSFVQNERVVISIHNDHEDCKNREKHEGLSVVGYPIQITDTDR